MGNYNRKTPSNSILIMRRLRVCVCFLPFSCSLLQNCTEIAKPKTYFMKILIILHSSCRPNDGSVQFFGETCSPQNIHHNSNFNRTTRTASSTFVLLLAYFRLSKQIDLLPRSRGRVFAKFWLTSRWRCAGFKFYVKCFQECKLF